MKSAWYLILTALADEDRHGLGIVRSVLDETDGAVRLWPATLYGALEAMTDGGLIAELDGDDAPEGVSAQRRYYRITPHGREALADEAHRLGRLSRLALERLGRA